MARATTVSNMYGNKIKKLERKEKKKEKEKKAEPNCDAQKERVGSLAVMPKRNILRTSIALAT